MYVCMNVCAQIHAKHTCTCVDTCIRTYTSIAWLVHFCFKYGPSFVYYAHLCADMMYLSYTRKVYTYVK